MLDHARAAIDANVLLDCRGCGLRFVYFNSTALVAQLKGQDASVLLLQQRQITLCLRKTKLALVC